MKLTFVFVALFSLNALAVSSVNIVNTAEDTECVPSKDNTGKIVFKCTGPLARHLEAQNRNKKPTLEQLDAPESTRR